MQRNSGAARQYDAAQPKRRKEQAQPKLKVVKGTKSKVRSAITFQAVLVFAIFVAAICFMVYHQAQLTEVTGEINSLNREIKVLQSENVRLQSVLEPTESLRILAERATKELSMYRLDPYDITYVDIYEEDRIQVAQTEEQGGIAEQIGAAIEEIRPQKTEESQ